MKTNQTDAKLFIFSSIGIGIFLLVILILLVIKYGERNKLSRNGSQVKSLTQSNVRTKFIKQDYLDCDIDFLKYTETNQKQTVSSNIQTHDRLQIDSGEDIKSQAKVLSLNKRKEVTRSSFEVTEVLGSGNFGTVYKGVLKGLITKDSKTNIAIKTVLLYDEMEKDSCERKEFLDEIRIMGYIDPHLNLVSMIGSCTQTKTELFLLIEYCKYGDLKHFLIKNHKTFIQNTVESLGENSNLRCLLKWTYDIANGMEYLTENKIMHGDLAARNIMLSEDPFKNGDIVALVADFGLSKNFYSKLTYEKSSRLMVPWRWMAIEYLDKGYFALKSDVWSFAVLIWEIFSFGNLPYGVLEFDEVLQKLHDGYRLPFPEGIPEKIMDSALKLLYDEISKKCFIADPDQRTDFHEIIRIIEKYLSEDEKIKYIKIKEEYNAKAKTYFQRHDM